MKIRTGFVSNSSSSSFILRGAKFSSDDVLGTLNVSNEEIDGLEGWELFDTLASKFPKGFDVHPDGNYFGGQDFETLIVGKDMGSLEDGSAVELVEPTSETDKEIIEEFEKLGFKNVTLRTYVQMISNDNY